MIRNPKELRRFEAALVADGKPGLERNLRIVEALHREAVSLGVSPPGILSMGSRSTSGSPAW